MAKRLPPTGAQIERRFDEAARESLQAGQDVAVYQREHKDRVADDDGHEGTREVDLPEEDEEGKPGQDGRHQERQEDDELQPLARATAAAMVVERQHGAEDE